MAAVLNAQLTAMLTALDGAAAGLGNEFVAHVGSTMAMAAAMPADWFPPASACCRLRPPRGHSIACGA